jgi:hypothetical protein
MQAFLDHQTTAQDYYLVSLKNSAQPMRDNYDGLSFFPEKVDGTLNILL